MKKLLSIAMVLVMVFSMTGCGSKAATETSGESEKAAATEAQESTAAPTEAATAPDTASEEPYKVGICWYNFADTFITSARNALADIADTSKFDIQEADSLGEIATQTNNMNSLLTKGVNALVLNNINTAGIDDLVATAKGKDIPIIFANTDSPSDETLASYDKVWHVSSAAEQSGYIQGDAMSEYWSAHPEADRNGDGKLNYIMLVGMQGNYDSEMRTTKSIERVEENGITVDCTAEIICNWSRSEAQNQVASLITANRDDIDAIFANNDDMALGAIEALKAAGFLTGDASTYIPVLGVDATEVGLEAIADGTLLVTSKNDPVKLAEGIYSIVSCLQSGQEVNSETTGIKMSDDNKHIWIDYTRVDASNYQEYQK